MTERESFISAMRDKPAEDTPRLVFADWLQERGEEDRAELIRVQVARARLNPRPVLRVFRGFRTAWAGPVREFGGEFVRPPGLRVTPGLTFDAVSGDFVPGAPLKTKAVGCVIEQFRSPMHAGEPDYLAGHVTGTPCPVRPEADALDAKAAALMLKIPFGDFCPATFVWHIDAASFEEPQDNGAVLVRRGFAEHVRCSWEDWLRWADWFRANHPCEKVTLTNHPGVMDLFKMNRGESPGNLIARHQEILGRRWPGTSFALPGGPWGIS